MSQIAVSKELHLQLVAIPKIEEHKITDACNSIKGITIQYCYIHSLLMKYNYYIIGSDFAKLLDQQQQMINILSALVQYNMQHTPNYVYRGSSSSQQLTLFQNDTDQQQLMLPSFNLQGNLQLSQSATSQAKQNALLQPQKHQQSQHSIQQPTAPQQQLDLTILPESASSTQSNVVNALNSQAEPMSFQQDLYASSQANSQSCSSALSDDLLSELENSTDDLEFLSSTSWPDQGRFNQQNSWPDQTSHQNEGRFNQQNSWPDQTPHQTEGIFNLQSPWPNQTTHQAESRCSQQNPPPLPFSTPPKLQPVEKVMNDHPGNDVATLRELAIALVRDAVFGREELIKKFRWQEEYWES